MIKADKKTLARIQKVYSISKQVWPQGRLDAYQLNAAKALIKEYAKKACYEPKKLDDLEKFFNTRLEWKKAKDEELKHLPKGDDLVLVDKQGKEWTVTLLKELINACYRKKEFDEVFEYYF